MHSKIDLSKVASVLTSEQLKYLKRIFIFDITTSTNDYLLNKLQAHQGPDYTGWLCLAEQQTKGRGRYGKIWSSPPGNIYCSFSWQFERKDYVVSSLAVAVAVMVINSISQVLPGVDLQFKWPNDVLVAGKKISGILIETLPQANTLISVIGVGINILPVSDAAWSSLASVTRLNRDTVLGNLLAALISGLASYSRRGLADFLPTVRRCDYLLSHEIVATNPAGTIHGTAVGIDEQGRLIILTDNNTKHRCSYGETSIKLDNQSLMQR